MQKFEIENAEDAMDESTTEKQRDLMFPVRPEGENSSPTNPWPRDLEAEPREMVGVQKRKPTYKRQGPGNRWDQYGESSSAASSEAHTASEQVSVESNWGPWPPNESGHKEAKPAQPYRLQKANKSDGQWSKWASDIRQSRSLTNGTVVPPDGTRLPVTSGERSWKHKEYESPEWDGSKRSAPTSRTLGGPEYDTDKEWQLRSMRYGDGWAYDSTHSHYKRAKPTQTDPEDGRSADPSLPMGSTSKTYDPRKDGSFWKRTDSG